MAKQARKAEKKGDFARAYLLYSQAAAKEPGKREYWVRAEALRRRASSSLNVGPGATIEQIIEAPQEPEPSEQDLKEARRPQPPFELKAAPVLRDFDLRGDYKALFEQVAKQYGLDVIFDGDYEAGKSIRFEITEANYRDALHALMAVTSSFIVPIGEHVFMVVKDTEQKRREVENHVVVSVPIPDPVTVQEAQELARSVQQLMEIQRFGIDSAQRVAIMRDRASKVYPAKALLEQMLRHRAEVELEVQLIASGKNRSLQLGLGLPTEFPIVPFGDYGQSKPFIPSGFTNFMTFGGGLTYLGIGVTSAQLFAIWSKSVARSFLQADLRTTDGQAVNFHAGDKYPIATNTYIGNVPSGAQAYTPPPSFNFEDLGIVLKITPRVHDSSEVTLEIEAEFKQLGAQSFNGIPVISNRKFNTRVRLRFDQAAIIAGLVNDTRTNSIGGLGGFIGIPVLAPLVGKSTRDHDESEMLLVIKPRLLSLPPTEVVVRDIYIGAESRLLTPM